MKNNAWQGAARRFVDLVGACAGIVCMLGPFLIISVLLKLTLGSPIFFRQERPGLAGKPFKLTKFRTMTMARNASGELLPDFERLTGFGRFLRRTSLDEVPELFNVLRGEMSLVGPRPLLMHYIPLYSAEQARRHEVKPGITGWAQVNGRNAITWEQRFALDVWYVDHQSLALDLKIIFKTFVQVLKGTGITSSGHATMPEFKGSKEFQS